MAHFDWSVCQHFEGPIFWLVTPKTSASVNWLMCCMCNAHGSSSTAVTSWKVEDILVFVLCTWHLPSIVDLLSCCGWQEEILARLDAERRLTDAGASLGRIEHGICSENQDGKIAEEVKEEMMVDVKSLKRKFYTQFYTSICCSASFTPRKHLINAVFIGESTLSESGQLFLYIIVLIVWHHMDQHMLSYWIWQCLMMIII